MNRRQFILSAGATIVSLPLILAFNGLREAQAEPRWFTDLEPGVAVGGYDTVAYFTEGAPLRGDAAISLMHDGVEWRFASEGNRERFASDPDRYAPRFGGYCAYAISQGYTAKGEPEVWHIVDGKLYLNYDRAVQTTWRQDVPGYISKAESAWPDIAE
jgi:YHS domain-containing protein